MDLVSCVLVTPERLRVPLLSSSPSPRYSEEKGLGDEEPRTSQALDKPLLVITTPRWARHESNLDRPDTNWEKDSESSLSTDNQNATVQPAAGEEVSIGVTLDPPLGCNGLLRLGSGLRAGRVTTLVPASSWRFRAAMAME